MSLHIEPTEDAVETLRKERRKNYIAALATSILSVVLAGAILYSLTIIIAPPEEPKSRRLHHAGRCAAVGYASAAGSTEGNFLFLPCGDARQGRGSSGRRSGEPPQDRH